MIVHLMRYEANYQNFKLAVVKIKNGGWQPQVINLDTKESFGDVHDGVLIPYPQYVNAGDAQEKACKEATRLASGTEISCAEAKLDWGKLIPDSN
jgi:hypothetical protein